MNLITLSFLMTIFLVINCNCSVINIAGTKPWSGCMQTTKTDLKCPFIPTDIPDGIKRVHLQQGESEGHLPIIVTKGMFSARNWNKIEYLEFKHENNPLGKFDSHGLSDLQNLRELHVHSEKLAVLHPDAFIGLGKLQVLDLSKCPRLSIGNLIQALNGSNKLPTMQNLSIAWMNSLHGGTEIEPELYEILQTKPLKSLNISNCAITFMDFQGFQKLTKLESLIATRIKLTRFDHLTDTILNLKLLDLSYATLPDVILGTSYLRRISDQQFTITADRLKLISKLETVNLSNILSQGSPLQIHNVTLILKTNLSWTIKHVNLRNSNFQYMDIKLVLSGCSHLESIDVSNNQMRFIYPDILKQCKKLKHIDLSDNSLNLMAKYNNSNFKYLTASYIKLTSINLSNNKLESIPVDFFLSNKFLEIIELSNNLLNQVEFQMEHLLNLTRLDLSNNGISVLSTNSMQRLQAMVDARTNKSTLQNLLDLRNNTLSCERCETYHSVKWILETILVDVQKQQLLCRDENSQSVSISNDVLTELEKMCERPSRIRRTVILSTFLPVVTIVFISVTIFLIRKRKRQQKYEDDMDERIQLINKNKANTRYLVFVSYSSADEMFVQKFVCPELTYHLKERTKTDRELVCIGDKHFRLGKRISDEMEHCLQQSAVMLILVSKNYCHSDYCQREFYHAQDLDKPIILMFKEEVDKCEMPARMRNVFTRDSRVLWEYKDGKPVLKTSWENVCTSILELMT